MIGFPDDKTVLQTSDKSDLVVGSYFVICCWIRFANTIFVFAFVLTEGGGVFSRTVFAFGFRVPNRPSF